jgi:hypothetical protein
MVILLSHKIGALVPLTFFALWLEATIFNPLGRGVRRPKVRKLLESARGG